VNLGTIAEINKALAGFIKTSVSSLADLEPGMLGKFGAPGRALLYQFMERVEETSVRLGVVAAENPADQNQVGRSTVQSENELLRSGWMWFKPSGQKRTTVAIQVTSGGKPLPGALVALWGGLPPFVGKTAEVITDAQGMARFENVAVLPGMAFKVTRAGYDEKNVVAVPDGTTTVQLSLGGFGFKWWMIAVPAGLAGGIWMISALMGKKKLGQEPKALSGHGKRGLSGDAARKASELRDRRDVIERKGITVKVEIPSEDMAMDADAGHHTAATRRDLRKAEARIARIEKCVKEIEEA